jgi:type VI protein secretion system component Hcp
MAVAVVALVATLGGTAWAATTITGRDVKNGSLTSADVKDGSLLAKDFKKGELRAAAAGRDGRDGRDGAAGAAGTAGASGATGQKGDTGDQAPPAPAVSGSIALAGVAGTGAVQAVTFGVVYPSSLPVGGGGGTGKATFSPFVLTRPLDALSPTLFSDATTGRHTLTAEVTMTKPGTSDPSLAYRLEDVTVTDYEVTDRGGSQSEEVTLAAVRVTTTIYTASGPQSSCWDTAANRGC